MSCGERCSPRTREGTGFPSTSLRINISSYFLGVGYRICPAPFFACGERGICSAPERRVQDSNLCRVKTLGFSKPAQLSALPTLRARCGIRKQPVRPLQHSTLNYFPIGTPGESRTRKSSAPQADALSN